MNVLVAILGTILRIIAFTVFVVVALAVTVVYLMMALVTWLVHRMRRPGRRDRRDPVPHEADHPTIVIHADGSRVH